MGSVLEGEAREGEVGCGAMGTALLGAVASIAPFLHLSILVTSSASKLPP